MALDPVSLFINADTAFCLPLIQCSNDNEKELFSKIISLLRQAGCAYGVAKGSFTNQDGIERECSYLLARNERAIQGYDYFRYLFFALGRILHLPMIITKSSPDHISVITCREEYGCPVGFEKPSSQPFQQNM